MNYLIFIIVSFLQPICWPLPEMSTILYGVLSIGPLGVFILGYVFILLGIIFMYKITFYLSEKYLSNFKSKKGFNDFKRYLLKNQVLTMGLLFILPVLPDEVICVGAAIVGIKFKLFFIIAAIAKAISVGSVAFSSVLSNIFGISQVSLIVIQFLVVIFISLVYKGVNFKK